MIRVAVVDDQAHVREGLAFVLNTQPDITVVATCASGDEVFRLDLDTIDVLLLDLYMPGTDGLAVLRALGAATRTLVLTTVGSDSDIREALALGASGFALKDSTGAELAAAVHGVHSGMTVISPVATRPVLTPRERDVLAMLGHGLSNQDIATRLDVAERMVTAHVGDVLTKLGLPSRTQAALRAEAVLRA
nr:response regulator transcription factor [Kibdelosporangium sp. MJ126-NF4]CEL14502.1 two component response regulator [Kibdelosporangium sp. MJ126-NF4]CTQ88867.1 two component response regulator [Kibdelosporangium sp. MJ126-NF4]